MSLIRQRPPSSGVLIALLLGACASLPLVASEADDVLASAADDARAKAFAPPSPGQAVIYFYRNGDDGGRRFPIPVIFDGREVAAIHYKTFFSVGVEPGAHDIWAMLQDYQYGEPRIGWLAFTPITVIAGQTYFVRVGFTEKNEVVNSETAKQELLACCKLAVPQSIAPPLPTLFQ